MDEIGRDRTRSDEIGWPLIAPSITHSLSLLLRKPQLCLLSADGSATTPKTTPLYQQLSLEQDLATGRRADGTVLRHGEVLSCVTERLGVLRAEQQQQQQQRQQQQQPGVARGAAAAAPSTAAVDRLPPPPLLSRRGSSRSDGGAPDLAGELHAAGAARGDERSVRRPPLGATAAAEAEVEEASELRQLRQLRQLGDAEAEQEEAALEEERALGERLRLLALLAVCRTPSDLELADAARAARLPATAVLSVQRALAYLGLPLHPPRQSGWHGEGALPEWSAVAGTPPTAVEPSPDLDRAAVERVVELRRHTPVLAPLLQHALGGTLPLDRYPFVDGDDAEEHVADPFERALASPRSELVGSWAFRRRSAAGGAVAGAAVSLLAGAQDGAGDKTRAPAAPPRLMVFMLGGASHAELRCAHEAGDEVGFGCTALLTPLQYVRALQQMGAAPMAPASDAAGLLSF